MRRWSTTLPIVAMLLAGAAGRAGAEGYVRGELGASRGGAAGLSDRGGPGAGDCLICASDGIGGFGTAALAGVAAGWRVTDWLRGDLAVDYRGRYGLTGQDAIGTGYRATVASWSVMGNLFLTAPWSWAGLTPFVAGGLGWARNRMSAITQTWPTGPALLSGGETDPGGSAGGFAWTVGAGLGWAIRPGWTLDLTARHVDLGRVGTAPGTSGVTYANGLTLAVPTGGAIGRLRANEIAVGLRRTF